MKLKCLPKGYRERDSVPEFDDTFLQDEWQEGVYVFAAGLASRPNVRTVIDYGAGSGYKLAHLIPDHLEKIAVESNYNTFEHLVYEYGNSMTIMMHNESPSRLQADNEGFVMICSDVIEHVKDPIGFMDRLIDVPWMHAVISTPCRTGPRDLKPPRNVHHYREWSFWEFRKFIDQWADEFTVRLHCIINPVQRTQMVWLER